MKMKKMRLMAGMAEKTALREQQTQDVDDHQQQHEEELELAHETS